MIPASQIDPRIAVHLEPGEQVLWQGAPYKEAFFGPAQWLTSAALALLWVAPVTGLLNETIPAMATASSATRVIPGVAAIGAAGLTQHGSWSRRGELWS